MNIVHYRNPNGFTIEEGKTAYIMPLGRFHERRGGTKIRVTPVVTVYDPASKVFVAGDVVFVPEVMVH